MLCPWTADLAVDPQALLSIIEKYKVIQYAFGLYYIIRIAADDQHLRRMLLCRPGVRRMLQQLYRSRRLLMKKWRRSGAFPALSLPT